VVTSRKVFKLNIFRFIMGKGIISPIEALSLASKRTDLPEGVKEIIKAGIGAYEELVIRDGLTGLYNRKYFDETLAKEIARSVRHNKIPSLIMLDIDNFKGYNDSYGHPEGDNVLRKVGSEIKLQVREIDSPCRYGGEEFAIILPETIKDNVILIAERIRRGIEKEVFSPLGKRVSVSASFGVTQYIGGESAEGLLERADSRLYQVKDSGRNRVCSD